jgi:hypothetical protein
VGVTIRRSHLDPAPTVVEFVIGSNAETQTVNLEAKASLLVADENDHEMKTQIGIVAV